MQYLLTFKTLIGYFIELNWPRIILNWIYYWIELAKNNFELNIFWIESWVFFFWLNFFLNWIMTIFFWIENWIESFSTVFFWIKNWIESFSSEIQSLIESSNCTSHGYIGQQMLLLSTTEIRWNTVMPSSSSRWEKRCKCVTLYYGNFF